MLKTKNIIYKISLIWLNNRLETAGKEISEREDIMI